MSETKEIPLTQGKVAVVDAEDYDWLSQWKWHAVKAPYTFYAGRSSRDLNGTWRYIRMHRQILVTPAGMDSDHRNGDGLDNRRVNLRICTRQENTRNSRRNSNNTSGCKGVCWDTDCNKWRTQIKIDGKQIHLGFYDNINEAIAARQAKEKETFGEFTRLTGV